MYVIRQVRNSDLEALERFAYNLSLGMLSLPKNRELLKRRIEKSLNSFAKDVQTPDKEAYLFVMEDTKTSEAIGTCGIYAKTGVAEPLYFFLLEEIITEERDLPIPEAIKILRPTSLSDGPSELCSLYLEKEYRKENLGELLSLSRFLYISENPHRFDKKITARLRGFVNTEKQTAPFWDSLGKHFLNMPFKEAQERQLFDSSYIGKFLPHYPVYVSLLPKTAQMVIQKTHKASRPALRMLKKEGFRLSNQVDIFDGGPVVEAVVKDVRTVKKAVCSVVEKTTKEPLHSKKYIISNTSYAFRACYGSLSYSPDRGAVIEERTAKALKIKPGDLIRFIPTSER